MIRITCVTILCMNFTFFFFFLVCCPSLLAYHFCTWTVDGRKLSTMSANTNSLGLGLYFFLQERNIHLPIHHLITNCTALKASRIYHAFIWTDLKIISEWSDSESTRRKADPSSSKIPRPYCPSNFPLIFPGDWSTPVRNLTWMKL